MKTLILTGAALACLTFPASILAKAAPKPPVARTVDVTETTFGQTVHDPYRWMEGQNNTEFATWLKAQGAYGRSRLDATPALAAWRKRLASAVGGVTAFGGAHRVGDLLFYSKVDNGLQAVLIVRYADGKERVLFDPNALAKGGVHASVTRSSVSPDGKIIALSVDRGGSEITNVEFYDVMTGAKLPDEIDKVWGEERVIWTPDSKALTIEAMSDTTAAGADPLDDQRVLYHVMGTTQADDKLVLRAGSNPSLPLSPHEFTKVNVNADSDWALVTIGGARPEQRVCVIAKTDILKPDASYRCIADYGDDVQDSVVKGNTLYLMALKSTPNGEVLAVDLSKPEAGLADAKTVVAELPDTVLTGLADARDGLYVQRMSKGQNDFQRVDYATGASQVLTMPYGGAAHSVGASPWQDGITFGIDTWNRPGNSFAFDAGKDVTTDLNLKWVVPKTYPGVEVVDTDIRSGDGTMVPVTILQPKGYKPDGRGLVVLEGYAAYGVSTQPFFDPTTLEWVSAGHIYVFVSARGGGEKGEAWHTAGKGPLKYKGAEDMIAASDAMVAMHYADRAHIAMAGASAGGTLLGDAMTMAPDRFGAVIIHAGEVNPSRLAVEPNGPNQYGEFGDATTPEGFKTLYDMDPYLHVRQGQHYPTLMLELGLNDNRVTPWNSGKFGARIIAAGSNTVLFNLQSDTGHFGTSMNQYTAQQADHFAFFEMAMPVVRVGAGHRPKP